MSPGLQAHYKLITSCWPCNTTQGVLQGLRKALRGCVLRYEARYEARNASVHLDSFYGTYSIPSTRQHANSIWLLLHAALRSYTGPSTDCFHYFAGTLLTNFLGLVAHNQLIPSRSAPIGVAACLLPYDLFFVFCLTLAQSGWSYIYWSCVDFPLTFCLNICVKVVTELRSERAAPCFGAMTHAAIQPRAA